MEKKITDDQVDTIIEMLEGTCDTLTGAVQEVTSDNSLSDDDLTEQQRIEIDSQVFRCEDCDWWYEISCDSEESGTCEDCYENSL